MGRTCTPMMECSEQLARSQGCHIPVGAVSRRAEKPWASPFSSVNRGDRTTRGLNPSPVLNLPCARQRTASPPCATPLLSSPPRRPDSPHPRPPSRSLKAQCVSHMHLVPVPQWAENAEVALLWMNIQQKPLGWGFREKSLWWPKQREGAQAPRALQGF